MGPGLDIEMRTTVPTAAGGHPQIGNGNDHPNREQGVQVMHGADENKTGIKKKIITK